MDSWENRIDEFWAAADDSRADGMRSDLEVLLAERGPADPRATFERASLHDFFGEEDAAIPLYRAAIAGGLAEPHHTRAVIQLASSLRNVGEPSAAIALLRGIPADAPEAEAARAFLALALHDDGKQTAALREALGTLVPHLPAYRRALAEYAASLTTRPRIRTIAVGLLVRDGMVLAEEYPATARHDVYLRAPGGGVEFGETADDAVRREFREELGATLDSATLLGVTENIYDRGDKRGHEIVFAYAIRCAALEALGDDERMPVLDSDTTVGWYPLAALGVRLPLYPAGMPAMAQSLI